MRPNPLIPTRIVTYTLTYFAEAHWDRLAKRISHEIGENTFKVPGRRVSITPAQLGGDVSLAGCHPVVVGRLGNPAWERAVAANKAAK